jgi:hypothetical protein
MTKTEIRTSRFDRVRCLEGRWWHLVEVIPAHTIPQGVELGYDGRSSSL